MQPLTNSKKYTFKHTRLSMLIAALACSTSALAGPHGGQVVHGNAQIQQNGNTTNILQNSGKVAINWQGFSISPHEVVNFRQPNASAVILNRVVGNERSVIQGALNANGQVFLINSNGILFTRGSQVNVGGLVASTRNISNKDFINGNYVFNGSNKAGASVINMGTINISDGGYAALLGQQISNQGVIVANKGTVTLSSGNKITLNFNGNSLVNVSIDKGTLNALIENKQAIYANGGQVILTAKAVNAILQSQVNNTGLIQAQTLNDLKGDIYINAYGGTAYIDGTLDASAPHTGNGGFIETSGDKVKIANFANITTKANNGQTGTWLIDPTDFTISTNGGDITGLNLSKQLQKNSVEIQSQNGNKGTQGNIYVNDKVTWGADTTLTLTADNNIYINKDITATGTNAGLALNYGGDYHIYTIASHSGTILDANGKPIANQAPAGAEYASVTLSGANAALHMNRQEYTLIHNMADFDKINQAGGAGYYALAQNVDASGSTYYAAVVALLGDHAVLAGLGHTVDQLTVVADGHAGLIAEAGESVLIRDIGITNANITSIQNAFSTGAGALLGRTDKYITVKNAYSTGSVQGNNSVGGLIGEMYINEFNAAFFDTPSYLINSFSTANVTSHTNNYSYAGGLVGNVVGNVHIKNSHATGMVYGETSNMGGLIGSFVRGYSNTGVNNQPSLSSSYATGNVTSAAVLGDFDNAGIGGLVGSGQFLTVTKSFASGEVKGQRVVGGLIGTITSSVLDLTYATGKVTSTGSGYYTTYSSTGGLVGKADYSTIRNSFATGDVYSTAPANGNYIGGLVGFVSGGGEIRNTYATGNVVGGNSGNVGGLVGRISSGPNYDAGIYDSYATGDVSGAGAVGGLVGSMGIYSGMTFDKSRDTVIENSQAYGNVTSTGDAAGGLVGWTDNHGYMYEDADGNIVFDYVQGNIFNSQAYGNVTGNNYVGGVVGHGANVIGSSSSGIVTGNDFVGGIAGQAFKVENSYTTSRINASGSNVGAIGGLVNDVSNNNYYDMNNGGISNGYGAVTNGWEPSSADSTGLTSEQMQDIEYYLDGTIEQVLAQREADRLEAQRIEAERLEAERWQAQQREKQRLQAEAQQRVLQEQFQIRIDTANAVAGGVSATTQRLSYVVDTEKMFSSSITEQVPLITDHLNIQAHERNYSADVQRIDVDGVSYELEE